MTALRIRARDLMTAQELIEVRTRSTWKSVALIAHAWTLILGSIAMVAAWPNPLTVVLAVAIIGSRQLGLAILMHDGAHGYLANGEKLNMVLRDQGLSPLSSAASRAHAAGRRSRPDPFGALSNHPAKLSPKILARYLWPDRICAAQGAVSQCAGRPIMAARAARRAFLGQARPSTRVQSGFPCGACSSRRVVGLSAIVARPTVDMDDGDHPYPQHRGTCGRA